MRKARRYGTIQRKAVMRKRYVILIAGLFFSVVLVLGIMLYNLRMSYQSAREDVLELSKNSSEQSVEDIEMFFLRHEDVLLTAAKSLEYLLVKKGDLQNVEELLRTISVSYNDEIYEKTTGKRFTGIYASVNGTLIHGMHSAADLDAGYSPLERPWYKEGKAGNGKVVFGEPYWDTYNKNTMVMTATKLLEDKTTVIGMDIPLEDLQEMTENMDISSVVNGNEHIYGYGFVVTESGVVMAHSANKEEQWKNYNDPQSPMYEVFTQMKKDAEEEKTQFREIYFSDTKYALFAQKLSNGWYAVTLTELRGITTSTSYFSAGILIVTAAVTLLALLYCFIITRAYVKSDQLKGNLQEALDLAKTDALTDLSNRTAYDVRVKELQNMLDTNQDASFALFMMDLNDLKYVNDYFGHAEGDRYILNCCALVKSIFPCDIYRIGGDEFVLFLTDTLFEQWEELYNRLKRAVEDANLMFTPKVDAPSFAVGIAIHYKGEKEKLEDLIRKADAEMYTNKLAIKQARLEYSEKGYTPDIKNRLIDKQLLASELHRGLENEQFEVWFQPQVNHTKKGSIIGAEALARWKHPERGMVSPAVFIPLFEYNGLIYELDQFIWRRTCKYIREWLDGGLAPLPISVNVSRLDILQPDFMDTITAIVEENGISYEFLHLEVTESAFSEDTGQVAEVVKELITRGFTIAIDDFGSGYSSLSLLRSVPAQIMKLDMRFFADENEQSRNECILESTIRMSKMLGMAVIAEGVEQVKQADRLKILGCDYIQGYLYSKPLPFTDFVAYTKTAQCEESRSFDTNSNERIDVEDTYSQRMFHQIISGTNEVILVVHNTTKQLLYANRAAEQFFGKRYDPMQPITCTDFCNGGQKCENCPAHQMQPNERREFITSYNAKCLRTFYTQLDWNGQDAFVYSHVDITEESNELEFQNIQEVIDLGLQEAMRQKTPEKSIEYVIGFIGRVLHGERAYIFEKNPDRTDSNTFEWVAEGISPEKENLQNIPEEVSLPWYEQFKKQSLVIIENLDDIKFVYPDLYEALYVQNIHSLVVAPFFDNHGVPVGFFGLDNPPAKLLKHYSKLVQTIAYFIEATLKRRNLNRD